MKPLIQWLLMQILYIAILTGAFLMAGAPTSMRATGAAFLVIMVIKWSIMDEDAHD